MGSRVTPDPDRTGSTGLNLTNGHGHIIELVWTNDDRLIIRDQKTGEEFQIWTATPHD